MSNENNRLYVGNLSFNSTEQSLRDAFSPHGEVRDVQIVMDRETGRSRGFAFVTMADDKATKAALSNDGQMLDGRALRVNPAESRRGGGGGGGGGGGSSGGRSRW